MGNWGYLKPELVSDWINFDRKDTDWKYQKNTQSMAAKQAEGVAYLWNLLNDKNLAILADEVGMGKTFQALGVISLLWKMKPSAKILVMAPNRDICRHWVKEYTSFLKHHYRDIDHSVRNQADGGPVHDPILCWNLKSLQEKVKEGWGHLYFTTIHSLSGLVEDKSCENKEHLAAEAGRVIKEDLLNELGDQGFDLLVIDEAHYFRNKEGNSQRAMAAQTFFGSVDSSLAQKVLLMTATPSHSGLTDVGNIISYFVENKLNESPKELLENYALRRLRLMECGQGKFHSKYHYREEKALPVSLSNNPSSELFFALYQKKLVEELNTAKSGKRLLYGYLEGFESVASKEVQDQSEIESDSKDESSSQQDSFRKAPDTKLLEQLTSRYKAAVGGYPEHPKYGALVSQFVPPIIFRGQRDLHEDKHLVFVRRIPSVREMTQRVNAEYDERILPYLLSAWDLKVDDPVVIRWKQSGYGRKEFNELIVSGSNGVLENEQFEDGNDDSESAVEDDVRYSSRISDLFVVKKLNAAQKETEIERTDCSNVRLRFRKPDNLFALLLEPASDYFTGFYNGYYQRNTGGRLRDIYAPAALDIRLYENFSNTKGRIERSPDAVKSMLSYDEELTTIWGLIYPKLSKARKEKLQQWKEQDPGILENFSNYIKSGMLFASPVMVELYVWFTQFNRKDSSGDVQSRYRRFIEFITPKLDKSLYLEYFSEALDSFEDLCEKIVDHELTDWNKDWGFLTRLQNPAGFASGESKNRENIKNGFNTPFYPNVLVATSVFQEGVNLHLQCRKVHHYGIAWTPGDNEQRVGRVDRLFGRVNKQLSNGKNVTLPIQFPYLERSFDEDQVGSFIYKKAKVEEEMDRCLHGGFSKEIQTNADSVDWKQYLRKPLESSDYEDPYPAKGFDKIDNKLLYKPDVQHTDEEVLEHIRHVLISTMEEDDIYNIVNIESDHQDSLLLLLDPKIQSNSVQRSQPIVIERNYSSPFSGLVDNTVYYVTFKSPICSKQTFLNHNLEIEDVYKLFKLISSEYPLIKLALDEDTTHSNFYLHTRVSLPIFVSEGMLQHFSAAEVNMVFSQIRDCSDILESKLFNQLQDLKTSDLKIASRLESVTDYRPRLGLDSLSSSSVTNCSWEKIKSPSGEVVQLTEYIPLSELDGQKRKLEFKKMIMSCLELNKTYHSVNFEPLTDMFQLTLCFPAVDLQEEELSLLENWFNHVKEYVQL